MMGISFFLLGILCSIIVFFVFWSLGDKSKKQIEKEIEASLLPYLSGKDMCSKCGVWGDKAPTRHYLTYGNVEYLECQCQYCYYRWKERPKTFSEDTTI